MVRIIGTLGKYDQRRLWKLICINSFDNLFKKSNLSLENNNLKWGKNHYEKNKNSNTNWPQLTAPFYSILFETSICQFNSSKCSPIIPDEVREHLTRSETIPSSRITPDSAPWRCLDSQLHDGAYIHSSMTVLLLFSSLHSSSTGFRSEDWNGHRRSLVLCSVTHFWVVF